MNTSRQFPWLLWAEDEESTQRRRTGWCYQVAFVSKCPAVAMPDPLSMGVASSHLNYRAVGEKEYLEKPVSHIIASPVLSRRKLR